ncbi:MAG: hypothetical protein ABIN69_10820 [Aestuariivirga sp.]
MKSKFLVYLMQLACVLPPIFVKTGTLTLRGIWIVGLVSFVIFAKYLVCKARQSPTGLSTPLSPRFSNLEFQNTEVISKIPGAVIVFGFLVWMALLPAISYYPTNLKDFDNLVSNLASIGSYPFPLVNQVHIALSVPQQDTTATKIAAMLSLSIGYCVLFASVIMLAKLSGTAPQLTNSSSLKDLSVAHRVVGIGIASFVTYLIWSGQIWATSSSSTVSEYCVHPLCFGQTDLTAIIASIFLGMISVFTPSMVISTLRSLWPSR